MIQLKNVKKENNIIFADYYPEASTDYKNIRYNIDEDKFNGELVGFETETENHLAHAKFALWDMAEGKREIKDCTIMWY